MHPCRMYADLLVILDLVPGPMQVGLNNILCGHVWQQLCVTIEIHYAYLLHIYQETVCGTQRVKYDVLKKRDSPTYSI